MIEISQDEYAGRHLRFGWWTLLVFMVLGLVLDALHGFKVSWYVNVDAQVRRLMWTLAHTHGTLVAIVNIAFALTLRSMSTVPGWTRRASLSLLAGSVLIPAGFFLGGITVYGGDPSPGAFLVPPGALLLIIAVAWIALGLQKK